MSAPRRKKVSRAVAALATGHSVLAVHLPGATELRDAGELLREAVIEEASFDYLIGLADGRADAHWYGGGRITFDHHCRILDRAGLFAAENEGRDYARGYTRGFDQGTQTHARQATLSHEDAAD